MFDKSTASKTRSRFWTIFGKLLSPIPNAEGTPINWINYKTSIKGISFKMDVNNKFAQIGIDITHKDEGIRNLYYEQFEEFKFLLETELNETWTWTKDTTDSSGTLIASIYTKLNNVNIYNEDDWQSIFAFFKTRIIALDAFWVDAKDIFKDLES